MTQFPTTRDDAPAYLSRYEKRRASGQIDDHLDDGLVERTDTNLPGFLLRARERSAERARFDQLTGEAPPDRSEAFARETVAPRELTFPEPYRQVLAGSVDVRLIRHGQTQGYVTDAALTPTGRWQAHRKGQDLAKGIKEGMIVKFLHAPTPRAQETAVGVYEGVIQAMARYGIGGATIEEPVVAPEFDNFKVYCVGPDGPRELDVTAAFTYLATLLDHYDTTAEGGRPGWMVEMDRFWKIQAAGGDPITHWLNHPMQYVEPAPLVIRRFWHGITKYVSEATEASSADTRIFVCSHSGPIRAVAAQAVGHDPGEPYNVEDVRIRVLQGLQRAIITYRGRGVEIEIPTTITPSWFA
jgi:broad specificity phosphatase PhoE